MSTAILALSENGDLQRIHDKWLSTSACGLESTEIESDRLHLKSFWGLFLICGLACFVALVIYFIQILRKYHHNAAAMGADSTGDGSTPPSRRIQTILSLMDDKSGHTKTGHRKRRVGRSLSENDKEDEEDDELQSSSSPKKKKKQVRHSTEIARTSE